MQVQNISLQNPIVQKVPYGIIYCTTNLVNGKKYIGKMTYGKYKDGRIKDWKVNYLGSSPILWSAIEKYGEENFIRETLQYCIDAKDLNESEIYWIDYFNAVKSDIFYNIIPGGTGGYLGEEAGKKIGQANSRRSKESNWNGFKIGIGSKPYADKISKAKTGIPWSDKQRSSITEAKKNRQYGKSVIQLEYFSSKIIKVWGSASQANIALVGNDGSDDTIAYFCRKNKCGVINEKRKRKNRTGFSWMYLEDYKKVYGK